MSKRNSVLLTKRVVDAARPDHERYHVWDSELLGFGLRIAPTGVKAFIIRYRADGGGRSAPQRMLTMGVLAQSQLSKQEKSPRLSLGVLRLGKIRPVISRQCADR